MYPSTNSVDGNISFTSINVQPMMLSSLYNYDKDVDLSNPFPHYITLEDETIYNDVFQQENYLFSHDHNHHHGTNDIVAHENSGKFVVRDGDGDINDGLIDIQLDPKSRNSNKRRRTSKKDRHSKIDTARGPRDRRMRLSVDVAKKFFKLQDMLGFDKASNTVEWLLMKSKSGIQELLPQKLRSNFMDDVSNNASSTSKVDNQCMVNEDDGETPKYQKSSSSSNNFKEKKKSTIGTRVRKSAHHLHSPLAKETRERARARARERTVEKSSKLGLGGDDQCSSKSRPCLDQVIDQYLHLLGPSSTIDDQPEQQISHLQFKQGASGDNSSLITANLSPSFLLNYQQAGFGAFPHEHQFNDFQILGNLWEGND